MTTHDIISAFIDGERKGKASDGRLQIVGDQLFNYNTCIGQRRNGGYIINVTKYSPTTSRHQNRLRTLAPVTGTTYVQGVPMGTHNLEGYQ